MSDQPLAPRGSFDQRAAKVLNRTMVAILGALAAGFGAWMLWRQLTAVWEIYQTLNDQQQALMGQLPFTVVMTVVGIQYAIKGLIKAGGWLRRRIGAVPTSNS